MALPPISDPNHPDHLAWQAEYVNAPAVVPAGSAQATETEQVAEPAPESEPKPKRSRRAAKKAKVAK